MDTIFALASARGKAGVAVVRVSGPLAHKAGISLAGSIPQARMVGLRQLTDQDGVHLDEAVVLPFLAGHSFTGEKTVELHLHGSNATVSAVLRVLGDMEGLRLAEPGEFTRRAMENGRLDLAQIEGLADLIDSETEAQRRQALRVFSGALGDLAEGWRTNLIRAAALIEATIDFADEEVPVDVSPEVKELITSVEEELRAQSAGAVAAERIREGFEVAIVGPPNVGKSTLLNALAGREAAITSEIAGTTRDVIEVRMDLKGLPVTILDTAGLRESDDVIEAIGIKRAIERAEHADLRVFLSDGNESHFEFKPKDGDIVVRGKADINDTQGNSVSGKTGQGVSQLIDNITQKLETMSSSVGVATRERHRIAMIKALSSLDSVKEQLMYGADRSEFAAEELHTAIRALDSLVGRVDVEQVLDEIFASFCLGK